MLEDDNMIVDVNVARNQLMNIPDTDFELCFMSASMNTETPLTDKINEFYYNTTKKGFNMANALLLPGKDLKNW